LFEGWGKGGILYKKARFHFQRYYPTSLSKTRLEEAVHVKYVQCSVGVTNRAIYINRSRPTIPRRVPSSLSLSRKVFR
jgi:hypothetical protein